MDEPTLREYVAVLRRRRRVVIVSVLVALGTALAISLLQTPRYRAESELLLRQTPSEALLVDELGQVRSAKDSERELNNEIRLIESRVVRDAVDDRYDGPLDVHDVQGGAPASDTNDVIDISLVSGNAEAAAQLVNLYAETYITERQNQQIENLLSTSEEIQTRLDNLRTRIAEVRQPLDAIDAQVAAAPADSVQRTELEDQRQAVLAQVLPQLAPLESRESSFRGQLAQLEISQDLTRSGGIEVLTPAEAPVSPVSPNKAANLVVGGLIGLLAGIGLAFAFEHADDSVGSKEDAERITDLPTLGVIPKVANGSASIAMASLDDPTSPTAEAYRALRTSVKFLRLEASMKTVLVTSTAASEGKTVTAVNLATVLAQSGDNVLLVAADLRRPRAHELFGAARSPGLTTVLLGEIAPEAAIYTIAEVPGLHLMPPGPTPPNPAELLDSNATRELLTSLAERYDAVIIDSPPVLPVTDPQVLARAADAVLLVIAYRETSKRGLRRAIELLGQVDATIVGTVLNLVPPKESYGGRPYRYETYRSRRRSRSERRRRREETATVTARPGHPVHLAGNGSDTAATPPGSEELTDHDVTGERRSS
jgi:capsular exopolysaccharide synthesis family protein